MAAQTLEIAPEAPDQATIRRVARALADGAIVVFPTETVYGLGASAAVESSVHRLGEIKGRQAQQPFTVHIGRREDHEAFVTEVTPVARRLIRKGWPGPITLVFPVDDPAKAGVHGRLSPAGREAIYGHGSVGIRFPDHRAAAALLVQADAPIIASSANLTGRPAPVSAEEIEPALRDQVDLILDGGPSRYRRGSSIVQLNGRGYKVLRAGVFDERTIRRMATLHILFVCTGNTCRSPMAEGLCKRMFAERLECQPAELAAHGVMVQSAGTMGGGGGGASPEAVRVCAERGVDLSDHGSRHLTIDLVRPADYIFTMTAQHRDTVVSLSPEDSERTQVLDPDEDIHDPIGGTHEDYERVASRIAEALAVRMSEVLL